MSEHKFACGECGQRLSATADEIGMAANCPTCGHALVIPPPAVETMAPKTDTKRLDVETKPPAAEALAVRPISPKLAAAIAATKAFGLTYRRPDWADEKGEVHLAKAIDDFFNELYQLTDLLHEMELAGEIVRLPDAEELQTVRTLLFDEFLRGQWKGGKDELKALIFQGAPAIRRG